MSEIEVVEKIGSFRPEVASNLQSELQKVEKSEVEPPSLGPLPEILKRYEGLTMPDFGDIDPDPLKLYKGEIVQIPLLRKGEDRVLARACEVGENAARLLRKEQNLSPSEKEVLEEQRKRGEKARDVLCSANLRLVLCIVQRLITENSTGLSFSDLVGEGNMALIRAAENYNWEWDVNFTTYAWIAIRNSLLKAIKKEKAQRGEGTLSLDVKDDARRRPLIDQIPAGVDVESLALTSIRQEELQRLIRELFKNTEFTPYQLKTLLLFIIAGPGEASDAQRAGFLGITPQGVRSRLKRIRAILEESSPQLVTQLLELLRSKDMGRVEIGAGPSLVATEGIEWGWFDYPPGGVYALLEGRASPVAEHISHVLDKLPVEINITPQNRLLLGHFGLLQPPVFGSRKPPALHPQWKDRLPKAIIAGLHLVALKTGLLGLTGQEYQEETSRRQTKIVGAFLDWARLWKMRQFASTSALAAAEEISWDTLYSRLNPSRSKIPTPLKTSLERRLSMPNEDWDRKASFGAILALATFVASVRLDDKERGEIIFSFPPNDQRTPKVLSYLEQFGITPRFTRRTFSDGTVIESYSVYCRGLALILHLFTENGRRLPLEVLTSEQVRSFMQAFFEVKGRKKSDGFVWQSNKVWYLRDVQSYLRKRGMFSLLTEHTYGGKKRGRLKLAGADLLRFIKLYQPSGVNPSFLQDLEERAEKEEGIISDFFRFQLALAEARKRGKDVFLLEVARMVGLNRPPATLADWARIPPAIPHPVRRILNTLGCGRSPEEIVAVAREYLDSG